MGDAYVPPLPICIFLMWLCYLGPLLLIAGPLWFLGRRRVKWNVWDFAIVVFPFAAWVSMVLVSGKSEKHVLFIGLIAPLTPVLRLAIGKRHQEKTVALALLVFQCALSAALEFLLPNAVRF